MIDFHALSQMGRHSMPLSLLNQPPLEVVAVVRYLPNKRLVVKGKWGGQSVYAKIFFGNGFEKYASRDRLGVDALKTHQINTPELLCATYSDCKSACILIFEALDAASSAEKSYLSQPQKRQQLAINIVKVLAQHHEANITQTDLYLKNFLVTGDDIYTLDGDGIRQYRLLSRKRALKNLAVLISKFDALEVERWLPKLLEVYATARKWSSMPDFVGFKRLVNQHRALVASHYADKKVFRQCTDVNTYRELRFFEAVSSNFTSERFPISVHACDRLIEEGISLKKGNTCTVSLAEIDGIKTVIKRYNIKGFWHGLSRAFRQTRAAASWANAHRLHILGIPTPKPIALIEQRFGFLRGKAYFLSEYLDAPDASTFFAQIKNKKSQAEATQNIVEMFYRMYLLKLSHGDMKSNNIKVLDGNSYLIDLDSMQQHAWGFLAKKRHAKDLKRFMRNWQDQPTLYNTFVKAFFAVYADPQVLRLAGLSVD
jgi:tRNA A-37 threonylcarbamoyl transferase component Bud32